MNKSFSEQSKLIKKFKILEVVADNKTDIQRDLDIQTYKVELLSKKINIMQYVEKVANTCVTNFDGLIN